ncbi:Magnetosome protein MamD [uncultured Gammaproteobacteria bacterium]
MLQEMVMAKVEGTTQASLLSGLTGKSFTVGQVTTVGNGMGTSLLLVPDGGATAAGQGAVVLKLEGTRQMAQMSGLVGKSVTIGHGPTVVGGMGKWVTFCPKAALAAKGGAGVLAAGLGSAGVAGPNMLMLQLEGATAAAQTPALAGKTFTVIKTSAVAGEAGKWLFLQPVGDAAVAAKDIVVLKLQNAAGVVPTLVGKTFTVEQGPIIAADNAGKFLFLNPTTGQAVGLAGKGVAGTAMTAKGVTAARVVEGAAGKCLVPTMKTAALQTAGAGTASAGTAALTAGKAAVATGVAAGGTIWSGTGLSLGLGLGLGVAGPLLLGALVAAAGYGIFKYQKNQAESETVEGDDLADAI